MISSKHFNHPRNVLAALRLKGVGMLMLLMPLAAISLSGCSDRDKNTSKILVRVNGDGITTHQLDAELARASPASEGSEKVEPVVRKQALEALIDRKILLSEAERNKVDRDPRVVQTVERYKTQAIVQAYLESQAGTTVKPSKDSVDAYFNSHPELFSHRKVLDINQLSIASRDFSSALKAAMDASTSLDQVEAWLTSHKIAYIKASVSYVSADLPADVLSQLQNIGKNHLFVLKDGDRDLLSALTSLVESPVPVALANSQIERFLMNKKMQEVAATEISRLRPLAKLDYVDKSDSDSEPVNEDPNSVTALNKK
ncbi:EpsD family peptidyl-prolyl cis-trans isomerase [Glaciimonas sp. PAMC28666]|uniref:EpsD family peptidyl-prolyl cis-trans isomerase n=1 Tax=Glaciimonas sp. PAMC28666 TaxID=2807626 RepID=UPI001963B36F|nr:EpsD family peptidyl-prolyl cis-trans isomerase [Glaciimonas sp. PAMC28666]QRX81916.1 EpsD family peptidyl-prolyl cis-trans isomerase [Glaciimonas sp. PAMC28666]